MTYHTAIRFFVGFVFAIALSACDQGARACLGGVNACGVNSASDSTTNSSTTATQSVVTTAAFTCTAVASPAQVLPGQTVQINVNAVGATGTLSIPGYVTSFANSVTLYGAYGAAQAGTVVTRTLEVVKASGQAASCSYRVQVLNSSGSNSGLGCTISIAQPSVQPGGLATFNFQAINATSGSATFSSFYPSQNWELDNSALVTTSATSASTTVQYNSAGPKQASVTVSSGGVQSFCQLSFNVGTPALVVTASPSATAPLGGVINLTASLAGYTNTSGVLFAFSSSDPLSPVISTGLGTASVSTSASGNRQVTITVTANGNGVSASQNILLTFTATPPAQSLAACSVQAAPLGYGLQQAAASIQGTVTRLRAFPQGGVGPFRISLQSVTDGSGGGSFPYDVLPGLPNTGSQQLNLRLRRAGDALIGGRLEDLGSNSSANCSTYQVSNPTAVYSVGADMGNGGSPFYPVVRVYQGLAAALKEDFFAFETTFTGGVRVAVADFDGDGIVDYLTGRGYTADPSIAVGVRLYAGSNRFFSANNPPPVLAKAIEPVFQGSQPTQVFIAGGDVTGDGHADIIVGSGCDAAASRIQIYSGVTYALLADFQPFPGAGGARLGAGDLNKDGFTDVVVSACNSSSGTIYSFSGQSITQNYLAYGANHVVPALLHAPLTPFPGTSWQAQIGVGDYNGDGYADIVTAYNGSIPGGVVGRALNVYSGFDSTVITSINPFSNTFDQPLPNTAWNVAMADIDGDGLAEVLLAGNKPGQDPEVRIFSSQVSSPYGFIAWITPVLNFVGSAFVAAGAGGL